MAALHCTQSAFAGRSVVAGTRAAPRPVAQARSGVIVRAEEAAGTLGGRPDPPSGGERGHWFPGADDPGALITVRGLDPRIVAVPPPHLTFPAETGPFPSSDLHSSRTCWMCAAAPEWLLNMAQRDLQATSFRRIWTAASQAMPASIRCRWVLTQRSSSGAFQITTVPQRSAVLSKVCGNARSAARRIVATFDRQAYTPTWPAK